MNPTPPKKNAPILIEETIAPAVTSVPASKQIKSLIQYQQGSSKDEDDVLNITIKKKSKADKKRAQPETAEKPKTQQPTGSEAGKPEKKRIKIDLTQNQTREFFSHGKVATMTLPESKHRSSAPGKAAIKAVSTIGKKK